jgi:hypothetical protein
MLLAVGVYCDVSMCVKSPAPLSIEKRARIIAVCIEEKLLIGECAFGVPDEPPAAEAKSLLERIVSLFKRTNETEKSFASVNLSPYAGLTHERTRIVQTDEAGDWLERRARSAHGDFAIGCRSPMWMDEHIDGGFTYLALGSKPVMVRTFNAYEVRSKRPNPFADKDAGPFYDVLSLSSRRNLDGKIASRSALVKRLRKELGVKITCRASWW